MPQMFQPPHAYIPDPNGKPYAGAKAYFYITGTTTPKATYSDYAMTVPNANPVIADANGLWGPIYLATDVRYRATLKTSTDVLIYTQDDVGGTGSTSADQVSFLQAGTGAVSRTVQSKERDIISVADFGNDLAVAVSAIGSATTRLLVAAPVSVTADLTVPSNIELRVEGQGLITLTAGKRLYINGPFSCDRLHKAFSASLISLTITADINANALNISATSANSVAAGQVVSGTGVTGGTVIAADYGVTGVGQVALNMYNGVLTSRSMTLTGGSVIFAKGTVDQVYPQWFGAVADGTTDCSDAVRLAVYSIRWGGKIKFPAGKYRVLSSAVLHGSLVVEGDGAGDTNTGAPPTAATQSPTFIFVDSDNANIFTIPPKADHVTVRDISFGTSLTTGLAPNGTNRKGITLNGHAPQFLFMPRFENCYFFQFQMGILVNDSWVLVGDGYAPSGYYWTNQIAAATAISQGNAYEISTVGTTNWAAITGTLLSGTIGTIGCRFLPNATAPTGTGTAYLMPAYLDWGVNPALVQNCEFRGNSYGIYFNTTNADVWRIVNCNFTLPANSSGVHLARCGLLKLDSCFAFGDSQANSEFVNVIGNGVTAIDTVTLDACQAEYCSHFLNYSAASTTSISVLFNVINCVHQLGADVYLGRMCQYNSYNTEVQSFIYVQATGVRLSSINDWYMWQNYSSGATWGPSVISGDANTINTYIPGRYPASTLSGPILNGINTFGSSGSGSPSGVVTPGIVGQEYLDTGTSKWYKATGLANTNWVALN